MRYYFAVLLIAFTSFVQADEEQWYALNREEGCEPLTWVYDSLPQLKGSTTPSAILKTLKKDYPDVRKETFLDFIAEEHKRDGSTPTNNEITAYKAFTRDNAFVLTFQDNNQHLILLTEKLCKSIYGSPKK